MLGRLETITDAKAVPNVTTFEYNAAGNRSKIMDALLRETASTYDNLNRLLATTQDVGGTDAVTTYTYDAVGNLRTVNDAEGKTTEFVCDRLSQNTEEKRPIATTAINYIYDSRNRLDEVLYSRGQKIDYIYHDWGAIDRIDHYTLASDVSDFKGTEVLMSNFKELGRLIDIFLL